MAPNSSGSLQTRTIPHIVSESTLNRRLHSFGCPELGPIGKSLKVSKVWKVLFQIESFFVFKFVRLGQSAELADDGGEHPQTQTISP